MNCKRCSQQLDIQKSDFVVCPGCGTINIPPSNDASSAQTNPDPVISASSGLPSAARAGLRLSKKKLVVVEAVGIFLLLFLSVGSFLFYQNYRATNLLQSARHDTESGSYETALKKLTAAQGKYSLAKVHNQIIDLEQKDKIWIRDNQNLRSAIQLSSRGEYGSAADRLANISQNFPDYKKVVVLRASITQKTDEISSAKTTPGATATIPTQTTTTAPKATEPKTVPVQASTAPQTSAGANLTDVIASINQKLQRYSITVTVSPVNNQYTYATWTALTNADANSLQQFAGYLTDEFGKYPTNLVTNSGLKTIGLVKGLQVSGSPRAAAPAPSITGMLYDVLVMNNAGSAYAREVVSHEYWHYLDYKMQSSYNYADTTWSACNTSGFTYGAGGASAYGGGYNGSFHPRQGFISQYATYAIEEDRSELFGWLMYNPQTVKNLNDSSINCKINRLTQIVHQLSPSMSF